MSILPQYTKIPELDDEQRPLAWKDDGDPSDETPLYPPRPAGPSGSRRPPNVTYIWNPRFPVEGEKEEVLGVFSSSKDETLAYVRRGFRTLREYDDDRIEFLVPTDPEAKVESWSRVLDEAWEGFEDSPPKRMMVQITDMPGDASARQWREARPLLIIFGIFFLAIAIVAILGAFGVLDDHSKAPPSSTSV